MRDDFGYGGIRGGPRPKASPKRPRVWIEADAKIQGLAERVAPSIQKQVDEFRECYVKGYKRSPTLSGTLSLTLVPRSSGGGQSVTVKSSKIGDEEVVKCLVDVAKRINLSPADDGCPWPIVLYIKLYHSHP